MSLHQIRLSAPLAVRDDPDVPEDGKGDVQRHWTPVVAGEPAPSGEGVLVQARLGVPYGEDDPTRQAVDLYTCPEVQEPVPLLIWIHGGGWVSGDRWGYSWRLAVNLVLACGGHLRVALVGYRLAPAVVQPGNTEDVAAGVRWCLDNCMEGVDPAAVFLGGHSVGAAMTATLAARGEFTSHLAGVVGVGGIYDFPAFSREFPNWDADFISPAFGGRTAVDVVSRANPAAEAQTLPWLILHSIDDDMVPIHYSDRWSSLLPRTVPKVLVVGYFGLHHRSSGHLGGVKTPASDALLNFLQWRK